MTMGGSVRGKFCGLHTDPIVQLSETPPNDGHLASHAVLSLLTELTFTAAVRLRVLL